MAKIIENAIKLTYEKDNMLNTDNEIKELYKRAFLLPSLSKSELMKRVTELEAGNN